MSKEWVTKDGRVLKLTEMSSDHLRNCMTMLKKNIEDILLFAIKKKSIAVSSLLSGEMAIDAANDELMMMADMTDEDVLRKFTLYYEMDAELEKRNRIKEGGNR